MSDPSFDEISKVIRYEPESGKFYWVRRTGGTSTPGVEAVGTIDNKGYVRIGVLGMIFKAHRLAWLLDTGAWPVNEVDHINGNRQDNKSLGLFNTPEDAHQAYVTAKRDLHKGCAI